jgi:ubiquinone/menaquinone biosynthesis C-methylase UbiE
MFNVSSEVAEWDDYWKDQKRNKRILYNLIASFYRKYIIKRNLNRVIRKNFSPGVKLLHAGSGGGEVDGDIRTYAEIYALDFSTNALKNYKRRYGPSSKVILADVRKIPVADNYFDGVYNLGVLEHFEQKEGIEIIKELARVTKKGGKVILFWPPEYGVSVIFFKSLVFFANRILRIKNVKFHPKEVNRLASLQHAKNLVKRCHLKLIKYEFTGKDLYTYVILTLQKS